ncbi:MAG: hypothetical protein AB1424_13615 [Thermodesulfobacteriota bacterium]
MHISEVKTCAPFNGLFEIKEEVVEAIAEHMRRYGFDAARPIVLWADKKIVIDGHTRLEAARRAGLVQIYCREFPFRDEDTALQYAIHNQRNRRNMTEAEILRCIEAVDKRKQQGERTDLAPSGAKLIQGKPIASSEASGKSAEKTAKVVGVSPRKIERARTVLADPAEKEAVLAGKKSIHKASRAVKEKRLKVVPYEPPISDQDKRQEVLLMAWEEIKAWQRKYSHYPEFREIFEAIDVLENEAQQAWAAK